MSNLDSVDFSQLDVLLYVLSTITENTYFIYFTNKNLVSLEAGRFLLQLVGHSGDRIGNREVLDQK